MIDTQLTTEDAPLSKKEAWKELGLSCRQCLFHFLVSPLHFLFIYFTLAGSHGGNFFNALPLAIGHTTGYVFKDTIGYSLKTVKLAYHAK